MKSITRYILAISAVFLMSSSLTAQPIDTAKLKAFTAPANRVLFHDQVVTEQKNLLKFDGMADYKIDVSPNPEVN